MCIIIDLSRTLNISGMFLLEIDLAIHVPFVNRIMLINHVSTHPPFPYPQGMGWGVGQRRPWEPDWCQPKRVLKCDVIILQTFPFEPLNLIMRYTQLL